MLVFTVDYNEGVGNSGIVAVETDRAVKSAHEAILAELCALNQNGDVHSAPAVGPISFRTATSDNGATALIVRCYYLGAYDKSVEMVIIAPIDGDILSIVEEQVAIANQRMFH